MLLPLWGVPFSIGPSVFFDVRVIWVSNGSGSRAPRACFLMLTNLTAQCLTFVAAAKVGSSTIIQSVLLWPLDSRVCSGQTL